MRLAGEDLGGRGSSCHSPTWDNKLPVWRLRKRGKESVMSEAIVPQIEKKKTTKA